MASADPTAWANPGAARPDQIQRGAYLFAAGGCAACHTDSKNGGAPLGGGVALDTPFGRFYTPNISVDRERGIGAWSDADFLRALQEGIAPDRSYYYPVFPYTSYTKASDEDLLAIKAYIFSLPPAPTASKPRELDFPFGWRPLLAIWRAMNFVPGRFVADPTKSESRNRGAYLAEALGHCRECHTPRGPLGGLEQDRAYAGTVKGPDGAKVPDITPDPDTGIGRWSKDQILRVLTDGALPDFDYVGGLMAAVVKESTSKLTDADRADIADYLMSLPPVRNDAAKATRPEF